MPVTYEYDSKVPAKNKEIFEETWRMFQASPFYQDLRNDLTTTVTIKDLGAGTRGEFFPQTGNIALSFGQGRYDYTPEEMLNTLLHELTHSAQRLAQDSGETFLETQRRQNPLMLDNSVGKAVVEAAFKALDQGSFYYGPKEPAAWLNANMRPGPAAKDPEVQQFIKANPDFAKEYYRRNAQPQRPVGTHSDAYPGLSTAEQIWQDLVNLFK